MKKTILPFILCLLYSLASFSQFELTTDGLKVVDSDKDYIVLDFKNKPKDVLFKSVLKTLTLKYNSAKDVLSKVENETISINGLQSNYVGAEKMLGAYLNVYDLKYKVNISFRDNKIKIDNPFIKFPMKIIGNSRELRLSKAGFGNAVIFKKNGKIKEKDAKKKIEDFFNTLVSEIKQGVENKQDDW